MLMRFGCFGNRCGASQVEPTAVQLTTPAAPLPDVHLAGSYKDTVLTAMHTVYVCHLALSQGVFLPRGGGSRSAFDRGDGGNPGAGGDKTLTP